MTNLWYTHTHTWTRLWIYNIKTCVPVSSTCIIYVVGAYIFYIRCNRSWKINRGAPVCAKGVWPQKRRERHDQEPCIRIYLYLNTHTHTYIIIYSCLLMYTHTHTWVHNAPNDQYDFLAPFPPSTPWRFCRI